MLEAAADAFAEVLEALGGILFVGKNEKLGRQSADDLEFNVVTDHLKRRAIVTRDSRPVMTHSPTARARPVMWACFTAGGRALK